MANEDADLALAVARAIRTLDRDLIFVVMPGLETERAGERLGLPIAREVYADRAYADDGTLVSRKLLAPSCTIPRPSRSAWRGCWRTERSPPCPGGVSDADRYDLRPRGHARRRRHGPPPAGRRRREGHRLAADGGGAPCLSPPTGCSIAATGAAVELGVRSILSSTRRSSPRRGDPRAGQPGLLETVPTYRSLLVLYDPDLLPSRRPRWLIAAIGRLRSRRRGGPPLAGAGAVRRRARRRSRRPRGQGRLEPGGCDRPAFGLRLPRPHDRVRPRLRLSRRPRSRIPREPTHGSARQNPAGSVSIGGNQTGVLAALELPSGWQLIGRTPARSYDPARPSRSCSRPGT